MKNLLFDPIKLNECFEKSGEISCIATTNEKGDLMLNKGIHKNCLTSLHYMCYFKPQNIDWLHENKIDVCCVSPKDLKKYTGENLKGFSECPDLSLIGLTNSDGIGEAERFETLYHETAHCKKDTAKKYKPFKTTKETDEREAIHYHERMIKRALA